MIPEWSIDILLNGKLIRAIYDHGEQSSGKFNQTTAYDRRPTIWLKPGIAKVSDEVEFEGESYRVFRILKTLDFDTCFLKKKKPPNYLSS